jgi:hypothetical protein
MQLIKAAAVSFLFSSMSNSFPILPITEFGQEVYPGLEEEQFFLTFPDWQIIIREKG